MSGERREAVRRHAERLLEMAVEMRLVGKAAGRRSLRDALPRGMSPFARPPMMRPLRKSMPALTRVVPSSVYIEEDVCNRSRRGQPRCFAEFGPEDASIVGIAVHTDKRTVDRITKGAELHT